MQDLILMAIFSGTIISLIYITQLRTEISRINSTLQKVADQVGITNSLAEITEEDEEFNKLIIDGKKIKAIKRLRKLTDIDLKEAKEYVDKIANESIN